MSIKKQEFIYEDADTEVGGGTTGVSKSAAPVAKGKAGLPNSKDQGDMSSVNIGTQVTSGLEPEETSRENNTKPTGASSSNNQGSLKPGSSMKEDIDTLFKGSDLSEEFRNKALVIFEAAVNAQIEKITESLEEEYSVMLDEAVDAAIDELAEKADDYLNYVADEWMKENLIAVTSGIRSEMVESFLTGLKGLFNEHYVDIPEDDEEVVEALLNKVNELEDRLNEEVEVNIAINKELTESQVDNILRDSVTHLTESQKDKFYSLAKGVSYNSADDFIEKLDVIKETYFPSVRQGNAEWLINDLVEEAPRSSVAGLDPDMAHYVTALSRTLKK